MSYTSDKEKIMKCFKSVQSDLSKTANSLLDIKTEYVNVLLKSINEDIMNNGGSVKILKKIEDIRANVVELEKKMEENYAFLKSAINTITKHLSIVEKKQRGFLDNVKIWKTKTDISEDMSRLDRQSPIAKRNFNFND